MWGSVFFSNFGRSGRKEGLALHQKSRQEGRKEDESEGPSYKMAPHLSAARAVEIGDGLNGDRLNEQILELLSEPEGLCVFEGHDEHRWPRIRRPRRVDEPDGEPIRPVLGEFKGVHLAGSDVDGWIFLDPNDPHDVEDMPLFFDDPAAQFRRRATVAGLCVVIGQIIDRGPSFLSIFDEAAGEFLHYNKTIRHSQLRAALSSYDEEGAVRPLRVLVRPVPKFHLFGEPEHPYDRELAFDIYGTVFEFLTGMEDWCAEKGRAGGSVSDAVPSDSGELLSTVLFGKFADAFDDYVSVRLWTNAFDDYVMRQDLRHVVLRGHKANRWGALFLAVWLGKQDLVRDWLADFEKQGGELHRNTTTNEAGRMIVRGPFVMGDYSGSCRGPFLDDLILPGETPPDPDDPDHPAQWLHQMGRDGVTRSRTTPLIEAVVCGAEEMFAFLLGHPLTGNPAALQETAREHLFPRRYEQYEDEGVAWTLTGGRGAVYRREGMDIDDIFWTFSGDEPEGVDSIVEGDQKGRAVEVVSEEEESSAGGGVESTTRAGQDVGGETAAGQGVRDGAERESVEGHGDDEEIDDDDEEVDEDDEQVRIAAAPYTFSGGNVAHFAALHDRAKFLQRLLDHVGADHIGVLFDKADHMGRTPEDVAVAFGREAVVGWFESRRQRGDGDGYHLGWCAKRRRSLGKE